MFERTWPDPDHDIHIHKNGSERGIFRSTRLAETQRAMGSRKAETRQYMDAKIEEPMLCTFAGFCTTGEVRFIVAVGAVVPPITPIPGRQNTSGTATANTLSTYNTGGTVLIPSPLATNIIQPKWTNCQLWFWVFEFAFWNSPT
jgi:hypothetical protein